MKDIVREIFKIADEIMAFSPRQEGYGYKEGPKTPWGQAQEVYRIDKGVTWYSTPSHGGLGVARGVAKKYLSPQARDLAMKWGGTLWYEEDCDWAIPFYEVPKWEDVMAKMGWAKKTSESYKHDLIEKYNPEYFTAEPKEEPPTVKELMIGDIVVMQTRPSTFEIVEIKGSKALGRAVDTGQVYSMPSRTFEDKVVKVERGGKVIWEK